MPDDAEMPPDPFGDAGPVQVVCPCVTDAFYLVLDGSDAKLICPSCKSVQAVFPRVADTGPHRGWANHPGLASPAITPERDVPPELRARAVWGVPAEPEGEPPPLPEFAAEQRNARLVGGPYDGQATWVLDDARMFGIAGVGAYQATGEVDGGLRVFAWQDAPGA